jgi:hypothetical protein
MNPRKLTIALSLALAAGATHAAGPLYLWEGGSEPVPYKWDTSETIPVYTDGGDAFTFDFDGVTPFITIERANEITQFAFDNWNAVPTSTFEAAIAGTIESQTGIADVTGANAHLIYDAENGYGFWVNYDTDGSILEDYFGVPRTAVLGIAFPELADESTGEIIEATAVINGWNVYDTDIDGHRVAGVFTHEFGHAINLSHSQTNGHIAYLSRPWSPYYPGVNNCGSYPALTDFEHIETMFPFIDHGGPRGTAQSTVNMPDDMAAISNLYPTDDYASSTGAISGVLRLKDGKTEYSGINVIARNVNDLYGDAVSGMSGDQTQGLLGPDGRFTINNLTPGEEYVLYIETIKAGGYPTSPTPLASVAEYWNAAESNDPAVDDACEATPILAEAGVVKSADINFNGYVDGIQYTPIVQAFLVDLAKNGRKSAGLAGATAFVWDQNHGFSVLSPEIAANNGSMTRNGQKMLVQHDFNGNGIQQATLVEFQGNSGGGKLLSLGDLNGDSCGSGGQSGVSSSYGWAVDDSGHTAVGLAYVDRDGDGSCGSSFKGELVPWIWTPETQNGGGMRELATAGRPRPTSWLRAQAISGNGQVVLGNNGGSAAVAWVNEGPLVDLYNGPYRTRDAYAVSYDGSRVALNTQNDAVVLWNPYSDEYTEIGGLTWCVDLDFIRFGTNFCDLLGDEAVQEMLGPIPVLPTDMNDDGTVIIGRGGSFLTGFVGGIWVEDLGWMGLANFLRKQGVMEAWDFPMDNPISIDATGDTMVGGLAGAMMSWHVDMNEVYVCRNGKSVKTSFPEGLRAQLGQGAEFGRCEFLD